MIVALWIHVFVQRDSTIRHFGSGAVWYVSRSRSVKNAPIAAVIDDEKRTVIATRNASASTLRSRPNAKNGVAASILAMARKSRRKSSKSPHRNSATITDVIDSFAIAAALNGRIRAVRIRRDHT